MHDLSEVVIREIYKAAKAIDADYSLTAETELLEEGLLTSLELLQLVMGLETELSISIPLESLSSENFATVKAVVALVEKTQNALQRE